MQFLRKLGLGLALFLYFPLLLVLASVISFNLTVAKSVVIKHNLQQSGVYTALSNYVTDQAAKNTALASDPILATSLKKTATAQQLQKITEPVVDTVYLWLNNPNGSLKVAVSVEPLKKSFTDNVIAALSQKLAKLPACSPSTPLQSSDPFQANCLPPGTTTQDVINQAKSQLAEQNIFPADNNLSLDSSKPTTDNNLATPIQDNNLKILGVMYRATQASWPYILGLLILCTAAILLLNRPRAKGFKRLGKLALIAAIMLVISSGSLLFLLTKFAGVRPGVSPTIATTFEEAGKLTIDQALRISLWFGAAYAAIGIAAISAGTIMDKKSGKKTDTEHVEKENLLPPDDDKPQKAENQPTVPKVEPKTESQSPKPEPERKIAQSTKIDIR